MYPIEGICERMGETGTEGEERFGMRMDSHYPTERYAQEWPAAVPSLQDFDIFYLMFGVDGRASVVTKETQKHMKWESTHSTGLSLTLTLRLPCLRKYHVLFHEKKVEKRKEEYHMGRGRKRGRKGCWLSLITGANLMKMKMSEN